jgi:hypothetical protein
MMRRRMLCGLLLLGALAGCVDFVEPDSLGLMKPANVQLLLTAGEAGCGTTPAGEPATLCLQATLKPGVDRYGRVRRMLVDTLYALGDPVVPTVQADTLYTYRAAWKIPVPQLGDSAFVVRFPVIDGVPLEAPAIRWYGFGRAGPDSLQVERDGTLRIEVLPPRATPAPQPRMHQWIFDFYGEAAVFSMRGEGFPWSTYRLPDALLAELRTQSIPARLMLSQIYFSEPRPDLVQYIQFSQHLSWRIRREE